MNAPTPPTAEITPSESIIERLAAEAVDVIGVRESIAAAADTIFAQIEGSDTFATGSAQEDAIFIATSLAMANAVVHYRTRKSQLAQARAWAHERWPDEDPTTVLATLTLIYMVGEGWKRFRDIAEKKTVWERIHRRVVTLIDEARTVAA